VNKPLILGIESSCDDTSIAIIEGRRVLSNHINSQEIHKPYGGVVPELASRSHVEHIVPILSLALETAQKKITDIDAIAFTQGPGLMGSLIVGTSFAKGLALALNKPLLPVHHMKAHILCHFIESETPPPNFPFLCLTVSGGHTQLVLVKSPLVMEIIGKTIDDAAGEAFDKAAKMLGLDYPGGPLIDQFAKQGNPDAFSFAKPQIAGYDYSFSGLKTSILYQLQAWTKTDDAFISKHLPDLCASIQKTIVDVLMVKLKKAQLELGVNDIAISGGVSANSGLRQALAQWSQENKSPKMFIPKMEYCTDNAAMIAIAGSFMFEAGAFGGQHLSADPKMPW
jgi:N6-L-threonylcarbamoyladenine synthase